MRLRRFGVVRFLLIAAILLPGIPVPGFFLVRPEELLAFVLLPAILSKLGKRLTWIDLSFVLVGVSTFVSTVWGTLILGVSIAPRDMMEFVKIIKAWTLFRLALAPWSHRELAGMAKTLLACVSVSALIGIVQWQDCLGLSEVLQSIYVTGTGNEGRWRMVGTVGNPNYYGLLMALGLALALNMWNYEERRVWRRLAVAVVGSCGFALFLTGSRSSFLATALAICLSLLMRVPQLRYRATWHALMRARWRVLMITILVVSAAAWTWNQFRTIDTLSTPAEIALYRQGPVRKALYRFSEVGSGFDSRMRLMWEPNIPLIAESPVFGWGPAKAEQRRVTDNGYILTLRRYGLIGLLCFLVLLGQAGRVLFKVVCTSPSNSISDRLAATALTVIVGYAGANLFAEVFYYLQLMSWLWLLLGIAVSTAFYPVCSIMSNSGPSTEPISCSSGSM